MHLQADVVMQDEQSAQKAAMVTAHLMPVV